MIQYKHVIVKREKQKKEIFLEKYAARRFCRNPESGK